MKQSFKIIDFHAHFPVKTDFSGKQIKTEEPPNENISHERKLESEKINKAYAEKLRSEWRLSHGFEKPISEKLPDEVLAKMWKKEVDKHNIEKIVFLTGGGNERLSKVVSMFPDKFIGFAHHNPHEIGADVLLRKAVNQQGLKGYKIIAPALDKPINDYSAYKTWETAAELDIPILIHFGTLGGGGGIAEHVNMSPLILHDVAKDFASVQFVIPHLGCGYPRELLQLMWACPNVHVDTSGSNQWIRWMPEEMSVQSLLKKFIETAGPERIVFGTDSNWFPRGFSERYFLDQVRDLRDLNVPERYLDLIFYENSKKLLKL